MTTIRLLTTFILFIFWGEACQTQTMEKHLWKDRLILTFAPDRHHPHFQSQIDSLLNETHEVLDRDLLIYQFFPDGGSDPKGNPVSRSTSEAFYEKYALEKDRFHVLLIGKDGGVKLKDNQWVKPKAFFELIDQMPMRRAEMKRKSN